MITAARWRKSSYSGQESACVELAHTMDALRDSKNPTGPTLNCPTLATFLTEVRTGRFNS
jgi:hypothetical protein